LRFVEFPGSSPCIINLVSSQSCVSWCSTFGFFSHLSWHPKQAPPKPHTPNYAARFARVASNMSCFVSPSGMWRSYPWITSV
jgi:hypothetical protein